MKVPAFSSREGLATLIFFTSTETCFSWTNQHLQKTLDKKVGICRKKILIQYSRCTKTNIDMYTIRDFPESLSGLLSRVDEEYSRSR